jgi:hypothetical protein
MNMCFCLIILNRLQGFRLRTPHNLLLPSSQIWLTPHCSPPIPHLTIHPLPLPCCHPLSKCHNLQLSLAHHHMHVYLTILLQVHVADQYSLHSSMMPLLVLGCPLVLSLLPLILLVTRLLQNLPLLSALLLLPALYLRQILPQLLHLVWIWWLISPLIRYSRTPPCHHFLLRHHPCSAATLWSLGRGNQRQQIWWPLLYSFCETLENLWFKYADV